MTNLSPRHIGVTRKRIELTPEQQLADFQLFEEFYRNQPPARRCFATGISAFDEVLGGAGIPSSLVTSWRAARTFAADSLLLELCRAACARGERVHLVDAADRFGSERLRVAGLAEFAAQGVFERTITNTIPALAQRVDAWRKGAIENAPDLLVVDSLVATIATAVAASANADAGSSPLLPGARRQGRMFERLLVKMHFLALRHASAVLVVEAPVVEAPVAGESASQTRQKKGNRNHQKRRRSNESLECAAHHLLGEAARVQLSLRQSAGEPNLVRAQVESNRFTRAGGLALIDVRGN